MKYSQNHLLRYLLQVPLFTIIIQCCYAQNTDVKKESYAFQSIHPINITEVSISDTTLNRVISEFIEANKTDSTFTKEGYLYLRLKSKTGSGYCFYFNKHYDILYLDDPDTRFPSSYSFVKGELVIIYMDDFFPVVQKQYNPTSKSKFIDILYQYTGKPDIQYATNEKGEKMTLRPTGNIMHGGGLNICLNRNGKVEVTRASHY